MKKKEEKKYDLFLLIKKKNTDETIEKVNKLLKEKVIEIKKEEYEMAYSLKNLDNEEHQYLKIIFLSSPDEIGEKKRTLSLLATRSLLLDITKQKNKTKMLSLRKPKEKKENIVN